MKRDTYNIVRLTAFSTEDGKLVSLLDLCILNRDRTLFNHGIDKTIVIILRLR